LDLDPQTLSELENYKLLIGAIVPRPIAWVTTVSANGRTNAAPFSAFTFLSTEPPMVGISIGLKSAGTGHEAGDALKDTARNMLAQREFVVNIADLDSLDALHQSAREFPADVSEIDVIPDDTDFRELGIDSMMGIEIVAEIERTYKISVPESELKNMTSLTRVYELVQSNFAATAAS